MAKRKRRTFTPEFKAEAVRLTRAGDRTLAQVARGRQARSAPHAEVATHGVWRGCDAP